MTDSKEFMASRQAFEAFIEAARNMGWLGNGQPDKKIEDVTYFDTPDLELYAKGITAAYGENEKNDAFIRATKDDQFVTFPLAYNLEKNTVPSWSLLNLFSITAHDLTGSLKPMLAAKEERTTLYLHMDAYEGEHSIVRVTLTEAPQIQLLQHKGQTSSETITIETVVGSYANQPFVEEMLEYIIADKMGCEAYETSVAETGYEFHKKFMPQAKDNPGNFITCDID